VPDQNDKVYRFAPLSGYSLRERVLISLADIVFFIFIKALGTTTRFEIRGWEHFEAIEAARKLPIYTFWHDRIFFSTYFWRKRGIVVLTSQSFDGEYIARFIQRFGYGAVRGSSSQGGARALVEMVKTMRRGHAMAFTVDGPRGPRYEAKLGPVILAKKTGNPILPFVVETRHRRTLKSWDKMQIPRPFSRAVVFIGEPIYVSGDASDKEIENKLRELQSSLDHLVTLGEKWREESS
jgi:lysophospholipid acyltransferase (LPLAT)-like uncharacterized protein